MTYKQRLRMFTSWSHSRWSDYEQCPAKAAYKHLDKIPEPKSEPMARGIAIAAAEEAYITGKASHEHPDAVRWEKKLHPDLVKFAPQFEELRIAYKKEGGKTIFVEGQWGFTASWGGADWRDWDNCQIRIKMDVARLLNPKTLLNIDFKTGKYREQSAEEYMVQLDLYATGGFSRFPEVEEVHAQLVYTDLGFAYPETPKVFRRDDWDAMKKGWVRRTKPMLSDTKFAPRPGRYCGWCHFSASKGGPCKF